MIFSMISFQGTPANAGKAEGRLCIVHHQDGFGHCKDGDIILLVRTKPNAAVVKMSKALLAVHGGVTSHVAIAARENHKPSVVGLPEEILGRVKDGDVVQVDADGGVVSFGI